MSTPTERHPAADTGNRRRPGVTSLRLRDQDGSVATEYGLLAVVAATIVAVVLEWATSGGISNLLQLVLARVSDLVGL